MKKKSAKIVFFGNERLATGVSTTCPTLRLLIEQGYEIACVVSNHEKAISRKSRSLEILQVAKQYKIPICLPSKLSGIEARLKETKADLGVLVAYGKMVPKEIINIFPKGIINIHPSLLPKYRGSTPIETAILDGVKETGVSIMSLVKEMDAGPVYGYSTLNLTGDESKQELADDLLNAGGSMLLELLPGIISGSIVAEPQNDKNASFTKLISRKDGEIDWHKSAIQIEREIRAYSEWPKSYTKLGGTELIIKEAEVVDKSGESGEYQLTKKSLIVYCRDKALDIKILQPSGKKEMSIQAFLSGYKVQ